MLVVKKTTQWAGKLKNIHIEKGVVYDEHDEEVNLVALLEMAYGDRQFDLAVSTKEEDSREFDMDNYID